LDSVTRWVDRLSTTRGDRFVSDLSEALQSPNAGEIASDLLYKLSDFRGVVVAAECGQKRLTGTEGALRFVVTNARGKGSQDRRYSALAAHIKIVGFRSSLDLLFDVMEARDGDLAELAAIELEFCDDPEVLSDLTLWLHRRLMSPRTPRQARVTANVMAVCLRLGTDQANQGLKHSLEAVQLRPIEVLARDGLWQGHIISGDFPIIAWPLE
jgi:hypothetical protein